MKHARVAHRGAVRSAIVNEEEQVLQFPDGRYARFDEVTWLPPYQPRTTFALGLNYADHAAELEFKAPEKPLIFLKGPDAFIGHMGETPCPSDVQQMHFECELAVVIGRTGRRIKREDALDYVGGYTIANDYALREYLQNFYRPNLRVKNRDLCTPLGPWLVDGADISDPMKLDMRSTLNGELVQQGNTGGMIFGIGAIVEYVSEFMTLAAGDTILTGTPHGIRFVKPGDVIVTEISEIGSLTNTIVSQTAFVNSTGFLQQSSAVVTQAV